MMVEKKIILKRFLIYYFGIIFFFILFGFLIGILFGILFVVGIVYFRVFDKLLMFWVILF